MGFFTFLAAALSGYLGIALLDTDHSTLAILAIVAAVLSAIAFILSFRRGDKRANTLGESSFTSPTTSTYQPSTSAVPSQNIYQAEPTAKTTLLTGEQRERVQFLVHDKQKIMAVKEIRGWTGLGLKDAKDLADAIERGQA